MSLHEKQWFRHRLKTALPLATLKQQEIWATDSGEAQRDANGYSPRVSVTNGAELLSCRLVRRYGHVLGGVIC